MSSYSVLHTIAQADFSAYTYYQVYVDAGATFVFKGTTLGGPTGAPIVLDLTVSGDWQLAGSAGSVFLLGKKKPQAFAEGPPGQNGVNTDGTWNIKG